MVHLLHYVKPKGNTEFYTQSVHGSANACQSPLMRFRIGEYRKRKGLTQQQVADRLGISVALYNGLESGKRRMNETYLAGLAEMYGVSPVQLIVDEVRADPVFEELDAAYRLLTPAERRILADSAKGIAAGRAKTSEPQ